MVITLSLIIIFAGSAFVYVRQAKFGTVPSGERLLRIQKSPNFKNGNFQNRSLTPTLAEGYSMMGELYKQIFEKTPRRYPVDAIPSVKTNLLNLPPDSDVLVWFGHLSYFMQVSGKKFLVDPVFSGNASPIPGTVRSFKGTDIYKAADMPQIDYLLITHDHYDHLDYETIIALKDRVKTVICGLGVGAHFEYWGFNPAKIIEKDWNEDVILEDGLKIHTVPGRHFSGRGFTRNKTLWLSYILQTPNFKIFLGGDGGYDTHFAEIGNKFGPVDLAILENGQYNAAWHYIHMLPNEVLKAAKDLKAKRLFPVHSSKFALARHSWDEPLKEIARLNKSTRIPLVTPMIGQMVKLNKNDQVFTEWWKDVN
ncbi:MAG: MBL fold metallo-hydrolase [Bacteroidota bacterium]|nr:MBL fold metallo-hydrolase [Bacteroidota bacterium]